MHAYFDADDEWIERVRFLVLLPKDTILGHRVFLSRPMYPAIAFQLSTA